MAESITEGTLRSFEKGVYYKQSNDRSLVWTEFVPVRTIRDA